MRQHVLGSSFVTTATRLFLLSVVLLVPIAAAAQAPRVYIEASETLDASNSRDKAKNVDFGSALAAALVKKQVPVLVVTDEHKAQWTIRSVSSQKEDSTGTKVAKLAFGGWGGGFTKFEGTVQVIDVESSGVLFAYNVKKGNFQSAAEAFAKHFKNYLNKRR
jgi:polyisoprenoid-binding protein YceI